MRTLKFKKGAVTMNYIFWLVTFIVMALFIQRCHNGKLQSNNRPVTYIVATPSSSSSSSSLKEGRIDYKFCLNNKQDCDKFKKMIIEKGEKMDFSLTERSYLLGMAQQESSFDPMAFNPSGARGLMGVKPIAADEVKLQCSDLYDPECNIEGGLKYLKFLKTQKFGGDFFRALVAYNTGPYDTTGGKVRLKKITNAANHKYVKAIKEHLQNL